MREAIRFPGKDDGGPLHVEDADPHALRPEVYAQRVRSLAHSPAPSAVVREAADAAPEAIRREQFLHTLIEEAGLEGQVEDGVALADRLRPRVRLLEVLPAEPDLDGRGGTTGGL